MIDFHNHVLPNLDDGAKNFDVALAMIKKAYSEGTTHIVSTVHFQHPQMLDINTDYKYLCSVAQELEKKAKEKNMPIKITPSAEVYFSTNLDELVDNPTVILNQSYMLVEFSPQLLPHNLSEVIYKIQIKGITPIIAHPERYRNIQRNYKIAKRWKEKDYILQINAGSILGLSGPRIQKTALTLLENGLCHLVGSDAHNQHKRPICLIDAYNFIEKKFDNEYVELLKENAEILFNNKQIINIKSRLKNESSFFWKLV